MRLMPRLPLPVRRALRSAPVPRARNSASAPAQPSTPGVHGRRAHAHTQCTRGAWFASCVYDVFVFCKRMSAYSHEPGEGVCRPRTQQPHSRRACFARRCTAREACTAEPDHTTGRRRPASIGIHCNHVKQQTNIDCFVLFVLMSGRHLQMIDSMPDWKCRKNILCYKRKPPGALKKQKRCCAPTGFRSGCSIMMG